MGEFFDRGPYVMDVIININKLKKNKILKNKFQ